MCICFVMCMSKGLEKSNESCKVRVFKGEFGGELVEHGRYL